MSMQKYSSLPASPDALVQNLKGAMVTTGSGGGGDGSGFPFMRIDHRTRRLHIRCKDAEPVPLDHRWAIPVASFAHGFKVWAGGKVIEEKLVAMAAQPAPPEPAIPFVGFGQDGPRKVTQFNLHSLNELGLAMTFSSMGVSHDNRTRNLLGDIVEQVSTNGPRFSNPLIFIRPSHYSLERQNHLAF